MSAFLAAPHTTVYLDTRVLVAKLLCCLSLLEDKIHSFNFTNFALMSAFIITLHIHHQNRNLLVIIARYFFN